MNGEKYIGDSLALTVDVKGLLLIMDKLLFNKWASRRNFDVYCDLSRRLEIVAFQVISSVFRFPLLQPTMNRLITI